jgi:hypothetical protein
MKRTVLVFGLIAGGLSSLMMLGTLPLVERIGFDKGEVIGYTSMVLAGLLIFFGIRSYRENVGSGTISFGRALSVGLLISLIATICYVATWEVIYFKVMPEFGDKFATYMVDQVKASGASPETIEAKKKEAQEFKVMYDKPLINAAITFLEPMPVWLGMTLVSAAILRKRGQIRA